MKKFLRNAVIAATLLGQFLRQMPSFTGSTIIQRQVKSHSLVTASIFAMSISAILFLWMKILLILFRRMVRGILLKQTLFITTLITDLNS